MAIKVKQPDWTVDLDELGLIRSLNWFNLNRTTKFAKKEFVNYIKSNKLCDDKYLKQDFDFVATDGFVSSLLSQGFSIPYSSLIYFNRNIQETINSMIEKYNDTAKSSRPKIVDNGPKVDLILGLVEHEIDNFFDDFSSDFSLIEFLISNGVGVNISKRYGKHYQKYLDELFESFDKKCRQLKEGYSFAGKRQLNKYAKFLQEIIQDCETYASTRRKPRRSLGKKISGQKLGKKLGKKKTRQKLDKEKLAVSSTQANLDSNLKKL